MKKIKMTFLLFILFLVSGCGYDNFYKEYKAELDSLDYRYVATQYGDINSYLSEDYKMQLSVDENAFYISLNGQRKALYDNDGLHDIPFGDDLEKGKDYFCLNNSKHSFDDKSLLLYVQVQDKYIAISEDYDNNLKTSENELAFSLNDALFLEAEALFEKGIDEETEIPIDSDGEVTPASVCASPSYRKVMKVGGIILNLVRILVPIAIIVFGAIDLYKAITSSDDKRIKKAVKSIIVRIIAGIAIFLLPGIVQFALNMVNEWSDYKNSWCCCTDCLLNPDCDVNSCNSDSCKIEGMD